MKIIERSFNTYKKRFISEDASQNEIEENRKAFYWSGYAVFSILTFLLDKSKFSKFSLLTFLLNKSKFSEEDVDLIIESIQTEFLEEIYKDHHKDFFNTTEN